MNEHQATVLIEAIHGVRVAVDEQTAEIKRLADAAAFGALHESRIPGPLFDRSYELLAMAVVDAIAEKEES